MLGNYLTQSRHAGNVAEVAGDGDSLPGGLDLAQPRVAVHDLDAALHKLRGQETRTLDLGQCRLLLGVHQEALAGAALVVVEVDDEVGEGGQSGHVLPVLRSPRGGHRHIFGSY